jgi:DNA polymerase-3 subunit gamma/tau
MQEMRYDDWYITEAPKSLKEVFGQNTVVKFLEDKLKKNTLPKNLLFQGEFGSGKTVLAKIVAKSIACKHSNERGEPCNECPSCKAVDNETWGRDVLYLNGEKESAQEIRNKLEEFSKTGAMRDRAKVLIMDETQALSPEATEAFLEATQKPDKGIFYIFTAMDKLSGKKAGALESRCQKWKLKSPSPGDVYDYLANFVTNHKQLFDVPAPKEFWTEGLGFIAQNSQYSFRLALQYLQQCYQSNQFTIKEIKETLGAVTTEDVSKLLVNLANGKINEDIFEVAIGKEFSEKFNLILKVLSDAEIYKAFGKLTNEDNMKWTERLPKLIVNGAYYDEVKEAFKKLAGQTYIKRGEWQLAMGELINEIKSNPRIEATPEEKIALANALIAEDAAGPSPRNLALDTSGAIPRIVRRVLK